MKKVKEEFLLYRIGQFSHLKEGNIIVQIDQDYCKGLKHLNSFSHANFIYVNEGTLRHSVIKMEGVNEDEGIIFLSNNVNIPDKTILLDIKPYFPCEDRIKECSNLQDIASQIICRLTETTITNNSHHAWNISNIGEIKRLNGEYYLYLKGSDLNQNNIYKDWTHIRVFWWFHRFDNDKYRKILIGQPPYGGAPRTGIFASRSPVRPNPLAMTTARILQLDLPNNRIKVSGLDCFDRTPLIHFVPYQPERERIDEYKVPSWVNHWPEWWKEETVIYSDKDIGIPESESFKERIEIIDSKEDINNDLGFFFDDTKQIAPSSSNCIHIRGARQNNLQNIDIEIPYHKVTVVTGVSGSGKSSLVFDTLFAESQRRFMDSMSLSERSIFDQLEKPDVESITGLPPAIAISQKSLGRNPRSTVGTVTDLYTYLSTLFAMIGKRYCPECGRQTNQVCHHCNRIMFELTPSTFSFNNPESMCPVCRGLGIQMKVDVDKIVTEPEKSLLDGASPYWKELRKFRQNPNANWMKGELLALAEVMHINLEKPWKELDEVFRHKALYGSQGMEVTFTYANKNGRNGTITRPVEGAVNIINRLFAENNGDTAKRISDEFMSQTVCDCCHGERLSAEARMVRIANIRFPETVSLSISNLKTWVENIPYKLNDTERETALSILKELHRKLDGYVQIGIGYLALNRSVTSLSGGELQRIKLINQLGSGISNILYVMDEPSAGLHPKDYSKLMAMINRLKEAGNTIVMVEHEEDIMKSADYVIDIGPGAGMYGGKIIATGSPQEIMSNKNSETGRYLCGEKTVACRKLTNLSNSEWIILKGIQHNNLQDITARFPTKAITCITGVSGSGKSSLMQMICLAVENFIDNKSVKTEQYKTLSGAEAFNQVVRVTQQPIGRTPRSNPATYTGLMDIIRNIFAHTDTSKAKGYKSNKFSFNSKEGQCSTCKGEGRKCIEVHFMPDIWTLCPACKGKRFNPEALEITYEGKTIADILDMNVTDALAFFGKHSPAGYILEILSEIRLGYIKLGQSALTLSGGEAQRIKLAKELSAGTTRKTLYLLDEPTSGLHFADIRNLLIMLRRITDEGNTVVIIEHNNNLIKNADWIIELGPEGGDKGGKVIRQEANS